MNDEADSQMNGCEAPHLSLVPPAPKPAEPITTPLPFRATDLSGSRDQVFSERLGEQMLDCLELSRDMSETERGRRAAAALGAMREIGARDGREGMIAAQMVAAHNAGLGFLARAVREPRVRKAEAYTRQSTALMTLFLRQMEVLERRRGQERQSLRIEHERRTEDGRTRLTAETERTR
jgi:hypothetical protein